MTLILRIIWLTLLLLTVKGQDTFTGQYTLDGQDKVAGQDGQITTHQSKNMKDCIYKRLTISKQRYNCHIQYNECSQKEVRQTESEIKLIRCQFTHCLSRSCSINQTLYLSEKDCNKNCYQLDQELMDKQLIDKWIKSQYQKQQQSHSIKQFYLKVIIIVLASIASIAIFILIVVIFQDLYDKYSHRCKIWYKRWIKDRRRQIIQLEWKRVNYSPAFKQDLKSHICRICQKTQIDSISSCNHGFHFHCFIKNADLETCPSCKKQMTQPLRVLCRNCYHRQARFPQLKTVDIIKFENNQIICTHCANNDGNQSQHSINSTRSSQSQQGQHDI